MVQERWRRFAYFSLHRLAGSSLSKQYGEFLALEETPLRHLQQLRAERLERLLLHASTTVPFYRQRVRTGEGLRLADFPVLTKRDIRENFNDLMSPALLHEYLSGKRSRRYSWMPVQTGGSTGVPTTVIHEREFRDFNRAARLYTQYMCGFPIGTSHFKLWGSMREINVAKGTFHQRVASRLAGEVVLDAFRMGEQELDAYVRLINESPAEHMMAYADAAHRMSEYILAERRSVRPLQSIMACAGTLTEAMRRSISDAFGGARIHNLYGSRDCGAMACECSRGSLHILDNKVILEIVDRNGAPTPAGEPGRILVTLLGNAGFPLIRYDIGDVGAISDQSCRCGMPTSILDRVEGRSVEFLVTSEGGFVSPSYFIHLIGVVHNPGVIRRFQIIQHAPDRVVLSLEVEPEAASHVLGPALKNIRRDLLAVFGPRMNLQIDLVRQIQESASGKFIFALNKTGQLIGQ